MDPVDALNASGGAATWRSFRARGVSWRSLDRARQEERVIRLRRGVYVLPDADRGLVAAVRLGGVLAGPTAAQHHGYDVLIPTEPYVAVPRAWSHAKAAGVRVLRVDLLPAEVEDVATSRMRTVLDCARRLPLREALVIVDSALHKGLNRRELERLAATARGTGARKIRAAVRLADGRSESPIETCVRLIVLELGLAFEIQKVIRGVGRVDLVINGWLVVEVDGFEYHRDRESYREDRRRNTALVVAGYVWLRFCYEDVLNRPNWVAASILAVLAQRAA